MREEKSLVGYAITSQTQVIEWRGLPPGTSAQKVKLMALTQALELRTGKALNIYTDSWYAYATLHRHRAIWRERVMLTAENKQVVHG